MTRLKITDSIEASDQVTKRWKAQFGAARLAYKMGALKEARNHCARAMLLAAEAPESRFATKTTEVAMAAILIADKKPAEAAKQLVKVVSALEGCPEAKYRELHAVALRFHAQALLALHDGRAAEEQLKLSLKILEALGPDALVQLAYSLSDLGGLYLVQSRYSEATARIMKAMKIMAATFGTDSSEYVRADMIYEACLPPLSKSKLEAAEDGITKMLYAYGANHPNISVAIERYLKHLEERGDGARLEEAKARFSEMLHRRF